MSLSLSKINLKEEKNVQWGTNGNIPMSGGGLGSPIGCILSAGPLSLQRNLQMSLDR